MQNISFKTFNAVSSRACKHSSHSFFIPVFIYLLQILYVLTKLVTRGQTAHADLVNTTCFLGFLSVCFGFLFGLFFFFLTLSMNEFTCSINWLESEEQESGLDLNYE